MAGQGVERREAVRVLALAAAAAKFPGFCLWRFACAHPAQGVPLKPSHYTL